MSLIRFVIPVFSAPVLLATSGSSALEISDFSPDRIDAQIRAEFSNRVTRLRPLINSAWNSIFALRRSIELTPNLPRNCPESRDIAVRLAEEAITILALRIWFAEIITSTEKDLPTSGLLYLSRYDARAYPIICISRILNPNEIHSRFKKMFKFINVFDFDNPLIEALVSLEDIDSQLINAIYSIGMLLDCQLRFNP